MSRTRPPQVLWNRCAAASTTASTSPHSPQLARTRPHDNPTALQRATVVPPAPSTGCTDRVGPIAAMPPADAAPRMTPAQRRTDVARKIFFVGLLGLPFLWLVNLIFFRRHVMDHILCKGRAQQRRREGGGAASARPTTPANPELTKCVLCHASESTRRRRAVARCNSLLEGVSQRGDSACCCLEAAVHPWKRVRSPWLALVTH